MNDGPDSVCSRWFRHFRGVLNVESVFDPDVLNSMEGRLPYDELDEPPTLTELKKALKSMKPGKAGGQSTILPDMILLGLFGLSIKDTFADQIIIKGPIYLSGK